MFCRNVILQIQKFGYSTKAAVERHRWTHEETQFLEELVSTHGRNWNFLKEYFEGRNASSLAGRYHYVVKRDAKYGQKITEEFQEQRTIKELSDRFSTSKKKPEYNSGLWSDEETQQLKILIKKHQYNWEGISAELGTRSKKQCYNRYMRIFRNTVNPDDEENIRLSVQDAHDIVNAVERYGLDFKLVKKELGLRINPDLIERLYKTQLDPAFCHDTWTEAESDLLVSLYRELDGSMELVQTRLPRKRSLQDMWDHYFQATQAT